MDIIDHNLDLPLDDIAPHVEAARAGFNLIAVDMMRAMGEKGVENAPAAVLSGAVEFATQIWVQTMLQAGNPPLKVREALIQQVKTYFMKWKDI